jgi:hypothetical protein
MRRFLLPVLAAGAILGAGAMPASASTAQAAAPQSTAASAGQAVPNSITWEWVYKGLYGTHAQCVEVGQTFGPWEFDCLKYYIGARPNDYEWELLVYEPVAS